MKLSGSIHRIFLVAACLVSGGFVIGGTALSADTQRTAAGAALSHDTSKGNCLACHAMPTDRRAVTSANIGPPLVAIEARFPDRDKLLRQIRDPGFYNPATIMPPFGKHEILTSEEIELIVDYLYTL